MKPPTTASTKAARVLTTAISIPSCVAVRKNTVGFINGDAMTNATIALNGTPKVRNDNPIGIAAYVGKGETRPTRAAKKIAPYTFCRGKLIFLPRKYRVTVTFKAMLIRRYGRTLRNNSTKSSTILSVYVPSNQPCI